MATKKPYHQICVEINQAAFVTRQCFDFILLKSANYNFNGN